MVTPLFFPESSPFQHQIANLRSLAQFRMSCFHQGQRFFFFLTSNQSCSFSSEDCKLQTELGVGPSSVTFKPAHLTSLLFNSRLLGQKPLTPQRMHYPGYSNLSQDR